MIAPELPAEIQPSAFPALHRCAHTLIDESGFDRTACAGCSSIPMTCVHGTSTSFGCFSSSGCTEPGSPTIAMSMPMASAAFRIGAVLLNVEVPDALGVRLDEFLAWLDVRAHQLLEYLVGRRGV